MKTRANPRADLTGCKRFKGDAYVVGTWGLIFGLNVEFSSSSFDEACVAACQYAKDHDEDVHVCYVVDDEWVNMGNEEEPVFVETMLTIVPGSVNADNGNSDKEG